MQPLTLTTNAAKALLNGKLTCFFAPILPPFSVAHSNRGPFVIREQVNQDSSVTTEIASQYTVGDTLYIKEPWRILFVSQIGGTNIEYQAGGEQTIPEVIAPNHNKWESAATMPEKAARQFIQITDVAIKHIQDICVEEILASGLDVEMPGVCKQSLDPNWPTNEMRKRFAKLSAEQQNEYLQNRAQATYIGWCDYANKLIAAFRQEWDQSIPPEYIGMHQYEANPFIYHVKIERK